jgi:hypothetical protein
MMTRSSEERKRKRGGEGRAGQRVDKRGLEGNPI